MILENIKLSSESIKHQFNDSFVKDATELFTTILDDAEGLTLSKKRLWERSKIKRSFEELDTLILKRFGLPMKHIRGDYHTYAVIPVAPKRLNVIAGDINETVRRFEQLQELTPKSDCVKVECVSSLDETGSVVNNILKSHAELQKVMNTKGVIINEETAKITGLTSDYNLFAITDVEQLINLSLKPIECVAILLHEIGHAFTHIAVSYRSVRFVESLIESLEATDGYPTKSRYKVIYKKLFGTTKMEENEDVRLLEFQKNMMDTVGVNDYDSHTSVESERMADEFTARFGLAKELTDALEKHYVPAKRIDRRGLLMTSLRVSIILIGLFGLISMVSFAFFAMMGILAVVAFGYTMVGVLMGGESSRKKVYDIRKERLARLRNEEIRTLRMVDNDDVKRVKIENVRYINEIIDKIGDGEEAYLKIFNNLPWHKGTHNETMLLRGLEEGMDNILHVSHAQFRMER